MPISVASKFSSLPFETFLCAPVGVESNGMTLTVMSAFARLDLDPWEKTSQLVALTRPAAIASLREMIGRLPTLSMKSGDEPLSTAERLAGLLPDAQKSAGPAKTARPSTMTLGWRVLVFVLVAFAAWELSGALSAIRVW